MENSFVLRGGEPQEKPARNATEGERERESGIRGNLTPEVGFVPAL